jgi:hypothetical protein
MAATYKVYVDWSGDGTFVAANEDVTNRVLDGRQPVTVAYGRDTARAGSPVTGGEAGFALNNLSRDYSPDNTSSPLSGNVLPGRGVYIKATLSAVDYTIFRGALDDFELQPALGDQFITASCLDGLARFRGAQISTPLYRGIRTGDAINRILDAMGWSATARDIDAGATYMPYWWLADADAFDAVQELVASEGQPALVSIGSDGSFIFRDRHHRLVRTASTAVQSTWRSSGIEPVVSSPTSYDHGWKEIINSVTYEVPIRQLSSSLQVAWSAPGRLSLAAGETLVLNAAGTTAVINAQLPVAGVDYTAQSGSVSFALPQTSGEAITLLVTAVGGAAVIDNLQLRALTVDTVTTVRVTVEDPGSISAYGLRSGKAEQTPVWASIYDALAVGEILVGRRGQRLPTVTASMVGAGTTPRLTQILTRNLSDRVHLTEAHTGLDSDMFVERIAHTIGQGGLEHRTAFSLEKVPTEVGTALTFDVAGKGFNDGRFQAMGVITGTAMLRFDTAAQGFDQGRFAY